MIRRGFTLLELLVALVLTSVVALLAYGTARAGIDTSERLEQHRATVETQAIVRSLIFDAIRHPVPGGGAAMNDTLFQVVDAVSAEGLPQDALRFFSHGVVPPLGASAEWMVTIAPSEQGLRVNAVPVRADRQAPVTALLTGVHGLDVRVLARTADSAWVDRWDVAGRVPAAVALEFLSERGAAVGPALIVHAALEGVR